MYRMQKSFLRKITVGFLTGLIAGVLIYTPFAQNQIATPALAAGGSNYKSIWKVTKIRELSTNYGPHVADVGPSEWQTLTCINATMFAGLDTCGINNGDPTSAMVKETWSVTAWSNLSDTGYNASGKDISYATYQQHPQDANRVALYGDWANGGGSANSDRWISQFPLQWSVSGTVTTP